MRTVKLEDLHEKMVRIRANDLKEQKYSVYADLSGFTKPPKISGFIPDVYAVNGNSKIIAEAETCDTLGLDHTRQQFKAFSEKPGTLFHVIVPKSCLEEAKKNAARWGIRVDQWWYQESC